MSDVPTGPAESPALNVLDKWTRFASEDLARSIDRRSFLKRAGSSAFFFVAALATGHAVLNPRRASAAVPPPKPPSPSPACAPPGPYCNTGGGDLSGCQGAHCFQHLSQGQILECHFWQCCYQAGCWTTASGGGYWTCCDCQCTGGVTCGCAQFSLTPQPLPMGGN